MIIASKFSEVDLRSIFMSIEHVFPGLYFGNLKRQYGQIFMKTNQSRNEYNEFN
jgi:hypothetical protein